MSKLSQGQVIVAKRSGVRAEIKSIDEAKDLITVEYINPNSPQWVGLFTYPLSDVSINWSLEKGEPLPVGNTNRPVNPVHNHSWKLYHGFNRIYEYCTLCDEKRDV